MQAWTRTCTSLAHFLQTSRQTKHADYQFLVFILLALLTALLIALLTALQRPNLEFSTQSTQ